MVLLVYVPLAVMVAAPVEASMVIFHDALSDSVVVDFR